MKLLNLTRAAAMITGAYFGFLAVVLLENKANSLAPKTGPWPDGYPQNND